jgi:hypothetical protein
MGRHLETDRATSTDPARYEPLDVPPFLPVWLAGVLASFVVLVLITITLAFPLADDQQYRGPLKPLPPAPRLQVAPAVDLQRYQAAKQQELHAVPSATPRSTVPIDAAMRATAQQGWGPPR